MSPIYSWGSFVTHPVLAQASSVGFDPPAKGVTFTPGGRAKPGAGLMDLSSTAAQRRASLELGMGGISHKSLLDPGGGTPRTLNPT